MRMADHKMELALDERLYFDAVQLADRRQTAVTTVLEEAVRRGLRAVPRSRIGVGKRIVNPGPQRRPVDDLPWPDFSPAESDV
jgi:hypothetical protein